MHNVFVIGDANVDIIVPYPQFLNKEKTQIKYPEPCLQGGGTSANTSVALSRLGVPVSFAGCIGDDQYGQYIQADFLEENIDISQLIIDKNLHTVGVFAFIDETGERYLWGWPRVNQAFKELDQTKLNIGKIKEASWIHSSGMALVHNTSARYTITEIFRLAWEAGIPTSFDLNLRVDDGKLDADYEQAVQNIIKYSSYVLGSGTEEFYYLNPKESWLDSARGFVTKDRTIIARMGKEGSMAITDKEEIYAAGYPVAVVDTVGAGDVYNAGFIAARLLGKDLQESLMWGNAVSGYTVERKGARNCPYQKDLQDFLERFGCDHGE